MAGNKTSTRRRRVCMGTALAAVISLLAAGPADAKPLFSTTVRASKAVERTCSARMLSSGTGFAQRSVRAPSLGVLQARLGAARGDWDLAVFDAKTGRVVVASSSFGANEVASDLVAKGRRLVVQACHRSGASTAAHLTVDFQRVAASAPAEKTQLVRVYTPTAAHKRQVLATGLDVTEHAGKDFLDVVLHGTDDVRAVQKTHLFYGVQIADLAARDRADRRADARYAARVGASSLPSGRTTYRHLSDYTDEMKALVQNNPGLIRAITLPNKTYEGRSVEGIEISTNVTARDGRPVFLQMGVHHAREWPSGEHAMEWAYELLNGYKAGNARATNLVTKTRTIVIPIVNPDGFNTSREFGELEGNGGGTVGSDTTQAIASHPYEYRRKNCRLVDDSNSGNCAQTSVGLEEPGVDPNRNYGGFWGGPGASDTQVDQTYRGPGPFSEPETRNIQWLISHRQVTALITNHTFSGLVLRPPGVATQGVSPDEAVYKALGDAMAAENGYASLFGYQLYDTTGTTEDWSYWATGGLGFTFEIGPISFHPVYADVVAEYEGTTAAARAIGGHGNREAYYKAQEAAADAAKHSVIAGSAPAGAVLRLKKTFDTPTSQRNPDGSFKTFPDTLDTTMVVPTRTFEWHVNPSTRPLAAQERGRAAKGPASPPLAFAGDLLGPGDGALPCADYDTEDPTCFNDHPFTVPGLPSDNAKATIRLDWPTAASDWDMKIYRDSNGDGSSVGEGQPVAESGRGITNLVDLEMPNYEQAIMAEPVLQPGKYVVRIQNYAAAEPYTGTITFEGPEPYHAATTESWTLTCEVPEGTVRTSKTVTIARGQRQSFDLRNACKPPKK